VRILLVGDYRDDPRLGSSKVLYKLREAFVSLGHVCDVLFAEAIGVWPRRRPLREAVAPLGAAFAVARAFRQRGPYDVVDVASGEGCVFGLLRRMGRYAGCVFVSRSNGLEHLNYRRMLEDHEEGLLHKPWTRRVWYPAVRLPQVAAAARLADRLLLLNDADRTFAIRRGWKTADAIDVVPHGVADIFLRSDEQAEPVRGAGVLFCGSWSDVKGVPYLAAAWADLVRRAPARLTIVGGGLPEQTIKAAFDPAAHPYVTVIDRVAEEDLRRQYRRHDLLVFPSTYEGFGMVVIEAMSQRLPVVATPVGCVPSLIRDGETGLVVPRRDANALASAVLRLLRDAGLRTRLAAAAYSRVSGMTWIRSAQHTLAVYDQARACTSRLSVARAPDTNRR
jgi:glycosyltransferase involved in cell wall biosynthesis